MGGFSRHGARHLSGTLHRPVPAASRADAERGRSQRDVLRLREAAKLCGEISDVLRKWKVDDMRIARFITRTMFCMFATDVGLLPKETFSQVIAHHRTSGDNK